MGIKEKLNMIQSILHRAVPRSWYDNPSPAFMMRAMFKQCYEVKQLKIKVGVDEYVYIQQPLWIVKELCKMDYKELILLVDTLDRLDAIKQLPKLEEEGNNEDI